MQSLCTLRDRCRHRPRNTRYQADATPYLGRTCTGWIAPACGWRTYSITLSARASNVSGTVTPIAVAVLRLITRLELCRLFDRQVFRLSAAHDFCNKTCCLPIDQRKTGAVSDETTLFRHFRVLVDRWQPWAAARSITIRRLNENSAAVSTFNAVVPDALALSIAGAIWSGALALKTTSSAPRARPAFSRAWSSDACVIRGSARTATAQKNKNKTPSSRTHSGLYTVVFDLGSFNRAAGVSGGGTGVLRGRA
jgi:hypothetical protein